MRDNETPMRTEATKKLFTVDEYYKIVEAGVFPEPVRTELIDGEIIEMTGMGVAHAMAITRANRCFPGVWREGGSAHPAPAAAEPIQRGGARICAW
jgi:Uma2 family endonuclease